MKITTSNELIKLAKDADKKKRNRRILWKEIAWDPQGYHVCVFSFLHNDREVRGQWLVKIVGTTDPITLWLDMDIRKFDELVDVDALDAIRLQGEDPEKEIDAVITQLRGRT